MPLTASSLVSSVPLLFASNPKCCCRSCHMPDACGSWPCSWPNEQLLFVDGSVASAGCQVGYFLPSGPTTKYESWNAWVQVSCVAGVHWPIAWLDGALDVVPLDVVVESPEHETITQPPRVPIARQAATTRASSAGRREFV